MAIIVPGNDTGASDSGSLESVIFVSSRPAYLTLDDAVAGELAQPWKEHFTANRSKLEQAIRATARVDTGDAALEYIGTAFAVGPRLAATAQHVARWLLDNSTGESRGGKIKVGCHLNFRCELGSKESSNVSIRNVKLIHPFFDFALLELGEEVEEKRWIRLSAVAPSDIVNREICVIGYPSFDPRNDKTLMDRIFGSVYGVKRVMPGHIVSLSDGAAVNKPSALVHDASTLGGTGGAPVVDLDTGEALGVNFAGQFQVGNYAIPSWELARDPYVRLAGAEFTDGPLPRWMEAWKDATVGRPNGRGKTMAPLQTIFTHDQILALQGELLQAEFYTDGDLATLTAGLPIDFKAGLPSGSNFNEKLYKWLDYLNDCGCMFERENHSPFYIVLTTARALRIGLPNVVAALNPYIKIVEQTEAKVAEAPSSDA